MRPRLLLSAARTTLFLAILSTMVLGDPRTEERLAIASMPAPPLPSLGAIVARLVAALPEPGSDPTPTDMPLPTATPSPTPSPTPTRVPANGPPTWIEAPSIQLSAPVVETGWREVYVDGDEFDEWIVPDDAAGFHQGTAYPGHPGNTVISGHNNMGSEVFRYLVDLNIGDEVILYVDQVPYRYRVEHKEIVQEVGVSDQVRRQNALWIAPTTDERLTLVTCWPYTGNSHRLIVVAMPIP